MGTRPAVRMGGQPSRHPGGGRRSTRAIPPSQNQQEHAEHDHHHDGHAAGVPCLAEPSGRPEAAVRPPSDAAPDTCATAPFTASSVPMPMPMPMPHTMNPIWLIML